MKVSPQPHARNDRPGKLLVPLFCGVLGTSGFQLAPFLLVALSDLPGWTAADAAIPLSVEFIAAGFASLTAPRLLQSISLRGVALTAMTMFFIGNAAGCLWHDYVGLIAIRGLVGIGEGLAMAVANIGVSRQTNPGRGFSALMVSILLFGFVGLVATPHIIARFRLNGVFFVLSAAAVLAIVLVLRLPRLALEQKENVPTTHDRVCEASPHVKWLPVLTAYFALFAAQGAIWAYIERIGLASGLFTERIGTILAASTLVGAFGAALSSRWSSPGMNALGIQWTLVASGILLLAFLWPLTQFQFAVAICSLQFLWCFASPKFLAVLARSAIPARAMAGSVFAQLAGLGAGPLLASTVMGNQHGMAAPVYTAIGFSFASLLIVYYGLSNGAKRAAPK